MEYIDMRFYHRFINIIILPAIIGLLVTFLLLIINPYQLFSQYRSILFNILAHELKLQPNTQYNTQPLIQSSYSQAVMKAIPAVVNIYTKQEVNKVSHLVFNNSRFDQRIQPPKTSKTRIQSSLGSGVLMNKDGYILTNFHVIEHADSIRITLNDGREAKAQLIGFDAEVDLAVLKIDLPNLPFINIEDSSNIKIGDVVLAVGNPYGVGQSVTMGIVGGTGRKNLGLTTYENYIQTDAAINPGNSGGALINSQGDLIGINSAIYTKEKGAQGIGFSIPINNAQKVLNDIIKNGHSIRGWIGISVTEVPPGLYEKLDISENIQGLVVRGVYKGGPSEQSGLQEGDLLISFNQKKINNALNAMNYVSSLAPNSPLNIEYLRKGQSHTVKLTVALRNQSKKMH
jgi:serine protease DegS